MSAEFWKYVCKLLLAIEVLHFGGIAAYYMHRKYSGKEDPDPEWENEVEHAGYDE